MNTKLSALLLGAVILMAFQSINDVVTEVGSTLKDVKQITLEQISKNDFDLPRYTMQVREACKKLPPGVREATMMNLGKVVKDYVKSPSFEAEYMAFIEKKATGPHGPLSQWALRWILDHPEVTTVIPGASSKSQVVSNVMSSQLPSLSKGKHDHLRTLYEQKIRGQIRGHY